MALVKGTNCGFVVAAPVVDPDDLASTKDGSAVALKDTAPAGAVKITEIGWWCDEATEETNFEVGLYSHDAGDDCPDARLQVDATNAKGTDVGWKTVSVDWSITAETIYWIAIQIDDTASNTRVAYAADAGERSCHYVVATLENPWGDPSGGAYLRGIYAVWEAAVGGMPMPIVMLQMDHFNGGTIL